jgi:hypothetical protein
MTLLAQRSATSLSPSTIMAPYVFGDELKTGER